MYSFLLLWLCSSVTRSYVPFQFTCSHYFTYTSGLKFEVLDDGANTHEKYGRICRRTTYDRCYEHEWTRCDRLFRNIRLSSRWEMVYGTVSWWVNAFFYIASSSKYVRRLVFKFLSETQRWDPKSKQALLIKKSDHSRYLFTHLQRYIKET